MDHEITNAKYARCTLCFGSFEKLFEPKWGGLKVRDQPDSYESNFGLVFSHDSKLFTLKNNNNIFY